MPLPGDDAEEWLRALSVFITHLDSELQGGFTLPRRGDRVTGVLRSGTVIRRETVAQLVAAARSRGEPLVRASRGQSLLSESGLSYAGTYWFRYDRDLGHSVLVEASSEQAVVSNGIVAIARHVGERLPALLAVQEGQASAAHEGSDGPRAGGGWWKQHATSQVVSIAGAVVAGLVLAYVFGVGK